MTILSLVDCRSKTPWNPYLSMKVKPSEQQMRESNKALAKGNKAYKEQIEKNRTTIAANNAKALSMKKHYHIHKAPKAKKKARR